MSKTAIYPGSFDPITFGHLDIIKRAASRIDSVIIAIFDNPDKAPIFSFEERKELIEQSLPAEYSNIQIATFTGLLADYAAMNNIHTVIRGLRAVSDFDYELQMAPMNRRLGKDIILSFL